MTPAPAPPVTTRAPSPADEAMRRLLRLPAAPEPGDHDVHGVFSRSILISATRCLLTYVVLPFVAPAVGFATGVAAWVGLPVGTVAIGANVMSIRRFWRADHRWRWVFTVISASVIVLLVILLLDDLRELLG